MTKNRNNRIREPILNYPYQEKIKQYDINRQPFSEYGHSIASDQTGNNVFVGAPGDQGGKLHLETRSDYGAFANTFTINPSHVSNGVRSS